MNTRAELENTKTRVEDKKNKDLINPSASNNRASFLLYTAL